MAWPKGKPRRAAITPPSDILETGNVPNTQEIANTDELAILKAELAATKAKLELRTEVQLTVAEQLAAQEAKRREFGKPTAPAPYVMPAKPEGAQLIDIRLDRNYVPMGYYEVVGYHKDAVVKKFPDGTTRETEPAEFIKGIMKPSKHPSVFELPKIWAGTVIRLVSDEAKRVTKEKIGSVELAD